MAFEDPILEEEKLLPGIEVSASGDAGGPCSGQRAVSQVAMEFSPVEHLYLYLYL